MRTLKIIITGVLVILIFGGLAASGRAAADAQPGSAIDPLVTRNWTDRYIQREFAKVQAQIAAVEKQVAVLKARRPVLLLTIGSAIAQIDEEQVALEMPPLLVNGRVFVPLRFVGEAFGVPFAWDSRLKKISYAAQAGPVSLTIGQKTAMLNGQAVILDAPAMVKNGRTLVPLRFIGESLGAMVTWQDQSKSVEIR